MRKTKFIIIVLLGCMVAPQTADAQMGNAIAYGISNIFKIAKNKKKQKELEKVTKALKENQTTQFSNANSVSNNQNSNTVNASENQNSNAENVSENQNSNTPSNPNDEVTLVVSSDGKTKDEAVKTALRSAIEQAYGTFVSANTTILNDELVKDEIVTISNGNIRNYEEIACSISQDGKTYVTLKATVSISKLVSYAQSKGATTEFAGATFGMNMRIKELNKKNEEIALKNLTEQVIALYPSAFSYKLTVTEPQQIQTDEEGNLDMVTLFGRWTPLLKKASTYGLTGRYEDYYLSGFEVSVEPNEQMDAIVNLIIKTFQSLELTKSEVEECKRHNIPYWESDLFSIWSYNFCDVEYSRNEYSKKIIYNYYKNKKNDFTKEYNHSFFFRSDCRIPFIDMNIAIAKILHSFEIVDNMGISSRVSEWEILGNNPKIQLKPTLGTNLLSPFVKYISIDCPDFFYDSIFEFIFCYAYHYGGEIHLFGIPNRNQPLIKCFFFIPKNEIHKYKSFTIRAVPVENTVVKDSKNNINKLYKEFK